MAVDPDSPRFARHRVLDGFGPQAQRRLATARIVVIGAGGLGSTVLPVLAAAGVGSIAIVDPDTVETSNLPRQTLYGPADVGRGKAETAAAAVAALAPGLSVQVHAERFDAATASRLVGDADLLIEGSDDPTARRVADAAAAELGIPLVWGSALGWSGQVGAVWAARGIRYHDLFPDVIADDAADRCASVGVLATVCAVIGAMMATETVKLLTGAGEPLLGRVAVYDARTGSTREIGYRRDPEAEREPAEGAVSGAAGGDAARRDVADQPMAHEPASDSVTAIDLARELNGAATGDGAGTSPTLLLDVREQGEAAIAALPGSVLIPLRQLASRLGELDAGARTVVYCHHGVRSAHALDLLQRSGFRRVRHLEGGIDAWSRDIDPTVPRY